MTPTNERALRLTPGNSEIVDVSPIDHRFLWSVLRVYRIPMQYLPDGLDALRALRPDITDIATLKCGQQTSIEKLIPIFWYWNGSEKKSVHPDTVNEHYDSLQHTLRKWLWEHPVFEGYSEQHVADRITLIAVPTRSPCTNASKQW